MSSKPTYIQLAGTFTISAGGRVVPELELGSRKGRILLKLLLVNRGHMVSTERIIEALWGEITPAHADENIAALVSRLRNVLARDLLQGGKGGYLFRPGDGCRVDLDEADNLVADARHYLGRGDQAAAATAAEAALVILDRGELLEEEPYADWTAPARTAARRLHRTAREVGWAAALGRGDHARALALGEAAVAADGLDEEAHRVRMLALYQGGEASQALVAYEELRARVSDELGADPSPESQGLHRRILQGKVDAPRGPVPRSNVDTGQAVGREPELASLRAAWDRAVASGPGLAVVVGEPGVGKTHLATALSAELKRAGALVLTTRCYEVERSLFLEPVLNALRPALVGGEGVSSVAQLPSSVRAALVGLMPDMAPLVGAEPPGRLSPEEERARAINAAIAVIAALARRRHVLLCIDDLHNSGPSTLEFLHVLMRRGGAMPLLILGTARSEGLGSVDAILPVAELVEVGPLAPDAIARLAEAFGLTDVPEHLAEVTGGNALYVVEALRTMRDRAVPDIPGTLRNAIRHRIETAGPELGEFLRAASVVGPSFDLTSVETLLGTEAARASRLGEDGLRRKILLESGIEYQFAHELVRETLYESVPGPTRAAWHGRIAAIKKVRGEPPQVVGFHAARAGDRVLARESYLAAAERAANSFSHAEAEEMLSLALAASEGLQDPSGTAEILVRRAEARMSRDDNDHAERDLAEAVRLARVAGDTTIEARAQEQRGWNAYFRRDMNTARDRLADATLLSGHGISADILAARLHHFGGSLELALESARSALAAAEKAHDHVNEARALSYLGSVDFHLDAYQQAIDHSTRAETLARRSALFHPTLNSLFFGALALGNRGDLAEALAAFERLGNEGRAADSDHYEARSLNCQAWMWLELGQASRAADLAAAGLEAAAAKTLEEPRANAYFQLARAALEMGDPDRATAMLDQGRRLGLTAAFGWRYGLRALDLEASILVSQGEDASEVAAHLLELALSGRAPKFVALALAHLGRRPAAERIARQLGSDLLMARVGLEPAAAVAVDSLAARLEPDLRPAFLVAAGAPRQVAREHQDPDDATVVSATLRLIASSAAR